MPEIKQVVTNEFYKQNYVAVGKQVFTKQRALQHFSAQKEHILNLNKMRDVQISKIIPVIYIPLPKNDVLIKSISNKRKAIYKNLNLEKSSSLKQKQIQAKKLFEYITKNLNYDMTTQEEILNVNSYTKVQIYFNAFNKELKQLKQNYTSYKTAKTEDEKKHFEALCNKNDAYLKKLEPKLNEEETKVQNQQVLQSIYYSLIKKRGICGEFAYAYSYLLEGLGIKNYVIDITTNINGHLMHHSINIIQKNTQKNTDFYAADVTLGVNEKERTNIAFNISKEAFKKLYGELKILHIAKLNAIKPNNKIVDNYYKGSKLEQKISNSFENSKIFQKE